MTGFIRKVLNPILDQLPQDKAQVHHDDEATA